MSDFQRALLISGGIAVLVLATGYGRRAFTLHSLIRPFVAIVAVAFFYLRGDGWRLTGWTDPRLSGYPPGACQPTGLRSSSTPTTPRV